MSIYLDTSVIVPMFVVDMFTDRAKTFLNGLPALIDLPLRAPDAIHIAIAQRLGAELATFDEKMAVCARALGASVAAI